MSSGPARHGLPAALVVIAFLAGTMAAPRPVEAFGIDTGAIVSAITASKAAMTAAVTSVQTVLNGTLLIMNTFLGNGFTQISNYLKAQVGAQEQIADANNMVQARIAREVRNAQSMEEHAVNREDCLNLSGGQAAVVAVRNADEVAAALNSSVDQRTHADKGTPAWYGEAQAAQSNNDMHFSRYCNDAEAEAGICAAVSKEQKNADQNASSLLTPPVYADQTAVTRANDYAMTLVQSVPTAALRGPALTSTAGQQSLPGRRAYGAAISLAHDIVHDVLSWHSGTVTLSDAQKAEAVREGITQTDTGSTWEATELEVNRRYGGTDWQADLQAMPPKSVMVQIALLDAQRNWLLWQQLKLDQKRAMAEAAQLAVAAEHHLQVPAPAPTP